jgi:hypothetical protein
MASHNPDALQMTGIDRTAMQSQPQQQLQLAICASLTAVQAGSTGIAHNQQCDALGQPSANRLYDMSVATGFRPD